MADSNDKNAIEDDTGVPPPPPGSPPVDGGNGNGNSAWQRFASRMWKSYGVRAVVAVAGIVAAIAYALPPVSEFLGKVELPSDITIVTFLKLLFGVMLVWFVILFTRPLTRLEEQAASADDAHKRQAAAADFACLKRQWMMFAYAFMVLALIAAVYPFTVDYKKEPHEDHFRAQVSRTLDSPISVFRGCIINENAAGKELHCYPDGNDQPPSLSWVLHAGGHTTWFGAPDSTPAKTPEEVKEEHAIAKKSFDTALKEMQAAQKRETGKRKQVEALSAVEKPDESKQAREELEKATRDLDTKKSKLEKARTNLIWAAYGLQRVIQGNAGYGISGGVVVPFYLIVLSLIGGAISLTRRVPEYQKQAVAGYVGTEKAPHLTPHELRERLVFQIVQFVSAPFLAVVSYYMLEPTTTAATVALAFAAGFASETVLLWVRGIIDKLKPGQVEEPKKGTVVGTIEELKETSASEAEKALKISVIGQANLPVLFADGGQFVVNGVPAGVWAIEVIKQGAANEEPKIYCRRLAIEAEKATPVVIKFDGS